MAKKNARNYEYKYSDIERILNKKSQGGFLYRVEGSTSQDHLHITQTVNRAVNILKLNSREAAVVVPINLGHVDQGVYKGLHWVGVVIRRNPPGSNNFEAFYNDSLGTPIDTSLPKLKIILRNHGIPNDRIRDFETVQQYNGYDCGAWTVLNLYSFARTGGLPAATEADVIAQRREEFGYVPVGMPNIAKKKTESQSVKDDDANADYNTSDYESSLDDDSEIQHFHNPVPELEELDIDDPNRIKFVLNIPMYVPPENMDELSSDLTDDDTFAEDLFNFDSDDKNSLPYRTFDIDDKVRISKSKKTPGKEIRKQVVTPRTGSLKSENPGDRDEEFDQSQSSTDYSKAHALLKLLTETGFDTAHKGYINNVKVSIGLNRPLSLSTRKNACLTKEFHRTEKTKIDYGIAAFFWDMLWIDKDGKTAEYDNVKKFYKQLKRKDPEKAKRFLEINEGDLKPSPPYQQLREYVKDHHITERLIQSFKAEEGAVIYFSSIDDDTKKFNGIYSSYLRIIARSKDFPTVMSTGYEFGEEYDGFPLHVGSKLERIIRIITAKTLPAGVYYPEPNFCVLIPEGDDTLPYSFIDEDRDSSTLESPILLRQVIKIPGRVLVFSSERPLITSGDRAKKRAQKDGLEFSDVFKNGGTPSQEDLAKLSRIIQSTANPRDWAEGVHYNRCFEIKGSRGVAGSFRGYIDDLFKDQNIQNALTELRKIVKPKSAVDLLYKAVKNLRDVLEKFYNPFDKSRIQNDYIYEEILAEFYRLESNDMLAIIHIGIWDVDELYRALNASYLLQEICKMYQMNYDKFMLVFSRESEDIVRSQSSLFEDITYEDLEGLYDDIAALYDATSSVRDDSIEELLCDDFGLFSGYYGPLSFKEITEKFLSFLKHHKGISGTELYDSDEHEDLENDMAYHNTVSYFADQFEQEYGGGDEDYEEDESNYESDVVGDSWQGEGILEHNGSAYWYVYTKAAMERMLKLRLKSAEIDTDNARIIHPNYIFNEVTSLTFIKDLVAQISAADIGTSSGSGIRPKLLIPVNISNQHWVGMTVIFANGKIIVTYMDSEANPMPKSLNDGLKTALERSYPDSTIEIAEKEVEHQKYNNCGLEVIENLIAAVAGEIARIDQEEALAMHSILYEQYLIEKALQVEKVLQEAGAINMTLAEVSQKSTKNSTMQEVVQTTNGMATNTEQEYIVALEKEKCQQTKEQQENYNITVANLGQYTSDITPSYVLPQPRTEQKLLGRLTKETEQQAENSIVKEVMAYKGPYRGPKREIQEEAELEAILQAMCPKAEEVGEQTENPIVQEVMAYKGPYRGPKREIQEEAELNAMLQAMCSQSEEAGQQTNNLNVLQTTYRPTDREVAQETTFLGGWMKSMKDSMTQCYSSLVNINPYSIAKALIIGSIPKCEVETNNLVDSVREPLDAFTANSTNAFGIPPRNGNTSSSEMLSLLEPMNTTGNTGESWVE